MKEEITKIAEQRMEDIKNNSKLSIAPAANSQLMRFMEENKNKYKVLDMMAFYSKEINRLSFKSFKDAF